MARGIHRAGEKAAVKQVQNRVFHSADVLINIHPIGGIFGHCWRQRMGRGKARVIPGRIHERIHRIGFAPGRCATFRAQAVPPCRVTVKRIAGDIKRHIVGQADGQVFLGLGHHAAGLAMDHRNRATPIALARNAPVAQTVIGDATPDAHRFAMGDGGGNGGLAGLHSLTRKAADIVDALGFHRHEGPGQYCIFRAFGHKHRSNWQAVFGGEIKIPLVMRGAAENSPGAVVHQHKIRDINRQFHSVIKRMQNPDACIISALFGLFQGLFRRATAAAFGHERSNCRIVAFQIFGQGVVGGNCCEGCAQQRIRPGGVDVQTVKPVRCARRRKRKLQTARFADPVGLHQSDFLGPIR